MTDATCRLAAVDVGSNSVRLLVADACSACVRPVFRLSRTTRLQAGLDGGVLSPEAMESTACVVADFIVQARAAGAERILAFGTSAMRDASNRDELRRAVVALVGADIEVITGEREAELAFAGAAPSGRVGVVDIGGGSAELIIGIDGEVLRAGSAPMGAVRLTRLLPGASPERLLSEALRAIEPLASTFATERLARWIGVGGTITTLAAMSRGLPKEAPGAVEGCPLSLGAVENWVRRLCVRREHEHTIIAGLSPQRAEIIPAGASILLAVMRSAGINCIYASLHDNLEGRILVELRKAGEVGPMPEELN